MCKQECVYVENNIIKLIYINASLVSCEMCYDYKHHLYYVNHPFFLFNLHQLCHTLKKLKVILHHGAFVGKKVVHCRKDKATSPTSLFLYNAFPNQLNLRL